VGRFRENAGYQTIIKHLYKEDAEPVGALDKIMKAVTPKAGKARDRQSTFMSQEPAVLT